MGRLPTPPCQNLSERSRIIRGVFGIWLLVMALESLLARRTRRSAITGIAGLGLLSSSATGFCGGNAVLNACERCSPDAVSDDTETEETDR